MGLARGRFLALIGLYLVLLTGSATAYAAENVRLDESQPGSNEVIEESPPEIRLRFNAEITRDASQLLVLNASAESIATGPVRSGSNKRELVVPVEVSLPDGFYTVQWRTRADAEDQSSAGFFTFRIGDKTDTLAAMPPETVFENGPDWITVSGTWLQRLGTTLSAGIVVTWILLVKPLVADLRYGQWLRKLALLGIGTALTGIGAHIVAGILSGGSPLGLATANGNGSGWLLLLGHLLLLGTLILTPALWRRKSLSRLGILGAMVATATLVPLAMSGPLSGEHFGYAAALSSEWLRLLAISLGLGGFVVLGGLLRFQVSENHPESFVQIVSRSITCAVALTTILILTSLYLANLTIGQSLSGLQTEFGYLFLIAISAGLISLASGGLALYRMNRSTDVVSNKWGSPTLLSFAAVMIASALLAEAALTYLPTAREQVLATQERVTFEIDGVTHQAAIHIAPGTVGINRITADIAGQGDTRVTDATQALVRVSHPNTLEGQRDVLLSPLAVCTADGEVIDTEVARFDATDALFGVPGEWRFDLIIHDLELGTIEESFELHVPDQPQATSVLSPPLRFSGLQAAIGFITGAVAISLLTTLVRNRELDAELAPQKIILLALTVFTVLTLWQGRITHTPDAQASNPVPRTVESVELGESLYQTHCAGCHGADAAGRRELTDELGRPPADLTDAHMDTHTAGDLAWWIREGIDPSMPGFGETLDEDEIWHLVNYLRSLRHPVDD